jgi:hypothetical protein
MTGDIMCNRTHRTNLPSYDEISGSKAVHIRQRDCQFPLGGLCLYTTTSFEGTCACINSRTCKLSSERSVPCMLSRRMQLSDGCEHSARKSSIFGRDEYKFFEVATLARTSTNWRKRSEGGKPKRLNVYSDSCNKLIVTKSTEI